jgi:DNA-binding winged helix-turn-helix (wHTH) protein/TolB-like protein/Tfp pilus assembly protein PilF
MKSRATATEVRLGYEFGGFVLDPLRRRLRRAGDEGLVELTPRVFDALLFFVERPGQLLERETLFQALWPGLVVEDNNLSQVLVALRRALGDEQHDRYVLTVPRRGFRFVCAVREVALDAEGRLAEQPPAQSTAEKVAEPVPEQAAEPAPALVLAQPALDEASLPATASSPLPAKSASPLAAGPAAGPTAAHPPAAPEPRRRRRAPFVFAGAGLVLVFFAAVASLTWWREPSAGRPAPPAATLAVLPFKPLLAEHRDEILELGMADSLIVHVSTTPGLVVRSIGSVRRFAGPEQDALAAARQLDVQWILDGTVQRWGDRVRLTARLLRAADGVAGWSGSFDERFGDVFSVQEQIAERVARLLVPHLGGAVGGAAGTTAAAAGTRDADAYQLYLTARYHAQTIRPRDLALSVELYQRAIDRDPGYALAHAGLADSLRRLIVGADAVPGPTLARARAAALRALELDPRGADGHAALGWVLWWHDWNWPADEQSFRRAIALNPNVAEAHLGLGHLLLSQRRGGPEGVQGLLAMQRARELDPLSRIANTLEASYLIAAGRRDEGLARVNKALQIEPDFWPAHLLLAGVHQAGGDSARAIEAARRAEKLSEGSAQAIARVGTLLAAAGRREEARATLERLLDAARERYVPPTLVAQLWCALGEREATVDWLDKALAARDVHLAFLKITPCLSALQGAPRYDALLRKLALPESPAATGKL